MRLFVPLLGLLSAFAAADPAADLAAANAALADKRNPVAARLYEQAVSADPALLGRAWGWAMAHYGVGDLPAALAVAERVLAAHPGHERARYVRGLVRFRQGELGAARADLAAVVDARPKDIRARFRLGQVLHALGQSAEAATMLRSVLSLRWIHQPARHALALTLRDSGDTKGAERALDELRRIEPLVPRIRTAERVVRMKPGDGAAKEQLRTLYGQAGRPP